MTHNPECGLDCVSAGAVRRPSAQTSGEIKAEMLRAWSEYRALTDAAPFMLEALKDIAIKAENFRESDPRTRRFADFGEVAQIARAAIAKAEGRDR